MKRWTPKRKAALIEAARLVTDRAAFAAQHGVPIEELNDWLERFNAHGLAGLSPLKMDTLRPKRAKHHGGVKGPISQFERDYRINASLARAEDKRRGR